MQESQLNNSSAIVKIVWAAISSRWIALNSRPSFANAANRRSARCRAVTSRKLHTRPVARPSTRRGREKRSKTKDLIGLLLSHGARAWRYSQPDVNIHLHVGAQGGRFPVILRLR